MKKIKISKARPIDSLGEDRRIFRNNLIYILDNIDWSSIEDISEPSNPKEWLAVRAGISSGYVYKIVNGKNFTIDIAEKVANALGFKCADMFKPMFEDESI